MMQCENCDGRGTVKNACTYCGADGTEDCDECGGSGLIGPELAPEDCIECDGTGDINCGGCDGLGYEEEDCDECRGTGEVPDDEDSE